MMPSPGRGRRQRPTIRTRPNLRRWTRRQRPNRPRCPTRARRGALADTSRPADRMRPGKCRIRLAEWRTRRAVESSRGRCTTTLKNSEEKYESGMIPPIEQQTADRAYLVRTRRKQEGRRIAIAERKIHDDEIRETRRAVRANNRVEEAKKCRPDLGRVAVGVFAFDLELFVGRTLECKT